MRIIVALSWTQINHQRLSLKSCRRSVSLLGCIQSEQIQSSALSSETSSQRAVHTRKSFLLKVLGHYKDYLNASNYRGTRTNNHWAYEPLFKVSYWRHDQLHSRGEKPPSSPSTTVGTKPTVKVLTGIWFCGSLLWTKLTFLQIFLGCLKCITNLVKSCKLYFYNVLCVH